MNTKVLVKRLAVAIGLVCVLAGLVQADKLALQKKLGQDIRIQLKDVTIAEALEKVGQEAGVKFVLSGEAEWKLPQGKATRLSVTMDGALADSMTEMLNAFFMRYAVGDKELTIYPRPELDHILGRPTAKQLELLRRIYTRTIDEYHQSQQNTINEALGEHITIVPFEAQDFLDRVLHEMAHKDYDAERTENYGYKLPGPMTVANMLGHVMVDTPVRGTDNWRQKKGEWHLSGAGFPTQVPEVRVVNEVEFRQAKLDQTIDVSFKEETAETAIQKLAARTGMELHIYKRDPSWLEEKISIDIRNVKLSQAMRNVVGAVDGEIDIRVDRSEIHVQGPIHERKHKQAVPKAATSQGGDYVGKISIPMEGGAYYIEFMLREKDLTDELRKLWKKRMEEILKGPQFFDITEEEPENK
jgi:hypothetical protein